MECEEAGSQEPLQETTTTILTTDNGRVIVIQGAILVANKMEHWEW